MKSNVSAVFLIAAMSLGLSVSNPVCANHVDSHMGAGVAGGNLDASNGTEGSSTGASVAKGCAGGAAVGTLLLPGLGTLLLGGVGCAIGWMVSD
jgi:hypothetical protein